jgi:hypothetical protein
VPPLALGIGGTLKGYKYVFEASIAQKKTPLLFVQLIAT